MSNCCPTVKAGWGLAVALVLLRVCVGFHFFKEGANKLQDPKPFSAMFFGGAKGPFAPTFQSMVWDADGTDRFDADKVTDAWASYLQAAKQHYGFDPEQVKLADERLARRIGSPAWLMRLRRVLTAGGAASLLLAGLA